MRLEEYKIAVILKFENASLYEHPNYKCWTIHVPGTRSIIEFERIWFQDSIYLAWKAAYKSIYEGIYGMKFTT